MVRLKLKYLIKCKNEFNSLNSTMVRLKHNRNSFTGMQAGGSQFHYGSIKTFMEVLPCKNKFKKSQFHYGSIKTICTAISKKLKFESQFHYGSIKTKIIFCNYVLLFPGLNSTMVRLKHNWVRNTSRGIYCLNSTMVRLKQILKQKERR